MAERSKALVLGTSIFGCAGSNPAAAIFLVLFIRSKLVIFKDKFTRSIYRLIPF